MTPPYCSDAARTDTLANRWAGERCYLDGRPAKITGRLNPVATVAVLPDGPTCEFFWGHVDKVKRNNQQFDSWRD